MEDQEGPLSELIEQARKRGDFQSEGSFSLDVVRARRKLGRFRLADPRAYILKLVQSAVAGGASRVEVTLARGSAQLNHDGFAVDPQLVSQLKSLLIGGTSESRWLQHLAVAINAGLELGLASVSLESVNDRGDGFRYTLTAQGEQSEVFTSQQSYTRIHLEGLTRGSSRMANQAVFRRLPLFEPDAPKAFFQDLLSIRQPEQALLRTHCLFSPIPVFVDGQPVNRPFFGFAARARSPGEDEVLDLYPSSRSSDAGAAKIFLVAPAYDVDLVPAPSSHWVGASRWWAVEGPGCEDGELLGQFQPQTPSARFALNYLATGVSNPGFLEAAENHPSRVPGLLYRSQPMLGCLGILASGWGAGGLSFVHDGVVVDHHRSGTFGVLSTRGLSLDLSGFSVVRDEAFQKVMDAVGHWCETQA